MEIRNLIYVVLDLEATYDPLVGRHEIIEIGACKLQSGSLNITNKFESLVRPISPINQAIKQKTGITDEMVSSAKLIEEIWKEFLSFLGEAILVDHQFSMDMSILKKTAQHLELKPINNPVLDTLRLAKKTFPGELSYGLPHLRKVLNINQIGKHRAILDAQNTAYLFKRIVEILESKYGLSEYQELYDFCYLEDPFQSRMF